MMTMRKQKTPWILLLIVFVLTCLHANSYAAQLTIEVDCVVAISSEDESENGIVVKFDLPSQLENSTIDLAEMYFVISSESADSSEFDLIAYPVQTQWNPEDVTWSELSDWLNDSLVTSGGIDNDGEGEDRLNLTHVIQGWLDGDLSNYGLLITRMQDANYPFHFESYPGASPSVKAVVKVYYTAAKKES
jgi:hypothetical protein